MPSRQAPEEGRTRHSIGPAGDEVCYPNSIAQLRRPRGVPRWAKVGLDHFGLDLQLVPDLVDPTGREISRPIYFGHLGLWTATE